MSEKKEDCEPSKAESSEPVSTGEMPAQSGGEVHVDYRPAPARPPAGHKIHPRKEIPPVPEGDETPDKTPTPPVKFD